MRTDGKANTNVHKDLSVTHREERLGERKGGSHLVMDGKANTNGSKEAWSSLRLFFRACCTVHWHCYPYYMSGDKKIK